MNFVTKSITILYIIIQVLMVVYFFVDKNQSLHNILAPSYIFLALVFTIVLIKSIFKFMSFLDKW